MKGGKCGVLVDLAHKSCTQQQKCKILNCPFGQFAPSYNYICVDVGGLQNAEPVPDPEVIQKKVFTRGYEVRSIRCLKQSQGVLHKYRSR